MEELGNEDGVKKRSEEGTLSEAGRGGLFQTMEQEDFLYHV